MVTEDKYKLNYNWKLVAEGILRYFWNTSAFDYKLKVCRQTDIGIILVLFIIVATPGYLLHM